MLAVLALAACACNAIIGLDEPAVVDGGTDGMTPGPPDAAAADATDADSDAIDADLDTALAPPPDTGTPPLPDCGVQPVLHVEEAGTLPCQLGADGGPLFCSTGTQCCDGNPLAGGGFAANDCETWGGACSNGDAGGRPIECYQPADCTANGVQATNCCLVGATAPTANACGYYRSIGGQAVQCEANINRTCAAGEISVCATTGDCMPGQTCVPMNWKIFQLGFCM